MYNYNWNTPAGCGTTTAPTTAPMTAVAALAYAILSMLGALWYWGCWKARAATDVPVPERPGDGPYSEGATGSHRGHAGAYGTANHSDAMPPRPPPPAYDDVFSPMAPAAASSSAAPQRSELPVYRLVEHLNTGGVTRRREPQPTDSVKSADS